MRGGLAWYLAAVMVVMISACQKESPSQSSGPASGPAEGPAAPSAPAPPASTGAPAAPGAATGGVTPAEFSKGESLFMDHCAVCHGGDALGTDHGPPLLNPIYQPDHHSDASFYLAIRNGARSHHWMFGNMPPVRGVSDEDATRIVAYIRWLQHDAGIF
jgi:mono/diheme cytochrome c family protein